VLGTGRHLRDGVIKRAGCLRLDTTNSAEHQQDNCEQPNVHEPMRVSHQLRQPAMTMKPTDLTRQPLRPGAECMTQNHINIPEQDPERDSLQHDEC
jgi:hypothetical protein